MSPRLLTRYALLVIAAGLAVRAWLALSAMPIVYPDEHFQTLEPASRIVFGFGWKSWEWFEGVRSWVVPGLFMPVLAALKAFGIRGGPAAVSACRLWIAAWSAFGLWGFHRLLRDRGVSAGAHLFALGLLALSPAMSVWSAATFSESWALVFLWGLMPATLGALDSERPAHWMLAGAALGLTFTLRMQMAAWMPALGILLLSTPRDRRILPALSLGYLVPVVLQGLLDWLTWGHPFHSVRANFYFNIVRGVADANGRSPWHSYFRLAWDNLGPWLVGPMLAVVACAVACRRLRLRRQDKFILAPALGFVVIHMAIGHKETRFILPAMPALFYLFAIALDGLGGRAAASGPLAKAIAAVAVLLAPGAAQLAQDPDRFSPFDRSELCVAIHRDGGLRTNRRAVLLLVDSSWVWTRGELLFGGKVAYREVTPARLGEADVSDCLYAIVPGDFEATFQSRTGRSAAWRRLRADSHGNVLLKRDPR